MIKKFSNTSIFNSDYTYTRDIVKSIGSDSYDDVLDYGARECPYKKFINHKTYQTLDIKQNSAETITHVVKPNQKADIKDNSFDLILLTDVIAHVSDVNFVFEECYRLLKKNGTLFLTTPFIYRENGVPNDHLRYTSFALEKILKVHGYTSFNQKKSGNFYYMIYTLINEKNIDNGEVVTNSIIFKYFFKLFNITILPLLNISLFSLSVNPKSSSYRHLIITVKK